MDDLHHLDLVELVLADHAARVLAVAPRFRAKARRVRRQLHRQRDPLHDLAAHGVRERDLGGRDQIQLLAARRRPAAALRHREHVGFELGQLRRADQRLGIDDVRRVALGVAVLARLHVEHELRERAVQTRERAAQEREARAGELRRGREVEQPRPSPMSMWSFTGKSNVRGVPQRRTSTLSSADLPTGTHSDAAGSAGSSRKSRSSACTRVELRLPAS